jgi:hypothetical protein
MTLYCYPVSVDEWPEQPEIVERWRCGPVPAGAPL